MRDLTPYCILKHGHHIKIDDFGFSKFIDYEILKP